MTCTRQGSLEDAGIIFKLLPTFDVLKGDDHVQAARWLRFEWIRRGNEILAGWANSYLYLDVWSANLLSRTSSYTFIVMFHSNPTRHLVSPIFRFLANQNSLIRYHQLENIKELSHYLWNTLYTHCNLFTVFIIHHFTRRSAIIFVQYLPSKVTLTLT